MIQYCTNCLLPSTKPDLMFNADGRCSACLAFENRKFTDWENREKEFVEILNRYRSVDKSTWDCIVPVSGGKDSTVQVLKILELGFNPLCVTSSTCHLSDLGRENIENIKNFGVDYIEISPNRKIRKKLNRIGLETLGDISWPEHLGIFTIPVRAAVEYKVPLLIWGENSQNEYGGPAAAQQSPVLNRRWLEEFGGLLGMRVSDLPDLYGIDSRDLIPYEYPSDQELERVGVTGLFLGHYFEWDGLSNYITAQANGFKTFGRTVEGSIVDYENLDNLQTGIHDYFKFLKFGFGRATDIASLHIRRGRMTRSQGLELVRKHDGNYPQTYLGVSLEEIISPLGLSIGEFDKICDSFTNKSLFLHDKNGLLIKQNNKSLTKINYDN